MASGWRGVTDDGKTVASAFMADLVAGDKPPRYGFSVGSRGSAVGALPAR